MIVCRYYDWIRMLWAEGLCFLNIKIKLKIKNTFGCNLKCPYCCIDIANGKQAQFDELSKDEWLRIIDNFPLKVGVLIFIGGEPFFRKDSVELINALTARGIVVKILTNLTYKRILDINPTPLVKLLATYHHHLDRDKWFAFYKQVKKKYRIKMFEVGTQDIGESEVLELVCNSDEGCYYRRDFIFTPNGELNMCIMDTCNPKGHQPKKHWEFGKPGQNYSIYSIREKLELMFMRNLRFKIKKLFGRV